MPRFGDFFKNGFKTVLEKNFEFMFRGAAQILQNQKSVENFFLASAKLFWEHVEFFFQNRFLNEF